MRPATDRPGFVLSTAAMALLIYTIIEAPDRGWGSARSSPASPWPPSARRVHRSGAHTREPMLDVSLFRNPRFTAASGSVTVAFFSLFGFIFLMTQYFQFIKGYGPLSAGVHLLPVATSVGVASVLGTKLAVRFGTKLVVASGLLMVAAFYAWVADGHRTEHALRHDRRADGALRHRHGLHQRTCDRGDHGGRADRQGRRRLGRQ